jgi:hypothetical protein
MTTPYIFCVFSLYYYLKLLCVIPYKSFMQLSLSFNFFFICIPWILKANDQITPFMFYVYHFFIFTGMVCNRHLHWSVFLSALTERPSIQILQWPSIQMIKRGRERGGVYLRQFYQNYRVYTKIEYIKFHIICNWLNLFHIESQLVQNSS